MTEPHLDHRAARAFVSWAADRDHDRDCVAAETGCTDHLCLTCVAQDLLTPPND